jgi:predicted nucleic acid-binding protein
VRERGASVPLTDIQIAVSAVAASAELWTRDADFERVSTVLSALRRFQPIEAS